MKNRHLVSDSVQKFLKDKILDNNKIPKLNLNDVKQESIKNKIINKIIKPNIASNSPKSILFKNCIKKLAIENDQI